MRKAQRLPILAIVFVTVACAGCAARPQTAPTDLPAAAIPTQFVVTFTQGPLWSPTITLIPTPTHTPSYSLDEHPLVPAEEVGLVWNECELPPLDFPNDLRQEQAEECFGRPAPVLSADERQNWVTGHSERLELSVGPDTYHVERVASASYTLYRNETELASLDGEMGSTFPNIALAIINGEWAWEFLGWESFPDGRVATVLYGGNDLRKVYGVEEVYRLYGMDGKLIFVGRQDGQYFIVYNGRRIGTLFDEILIAHCCGLMGASVRFGDGRYVFWGLRDGRSYVVEITPKP
jgi:hypothetical protein